MAATKKTRSKPRRAKAQAGSLVGTVVGEINGFPIRRVLVKELRTAGYNPREISEEALDGLRCSVEAFGLPQPIVWNRRTRRVVGGHQRLKTLDPGSTTEVVEVDLDEAKEKALNLALNNPHIAGTFTAALGSVLGDLEVQVPDLSSSLRLNELQVDVPVDMDELLDESAAPAKEKGKKKAGTGRRADSDEGAEWDPAELRQIILVMNAQEHDEATEALNAVMENEGAESFTSAVLWLLRNYVEQ